MPFIFLGISLGNISVIKFENYVENEKNLELFKEKENADRLTSALKIEGENRQKKIDFFSSQIKNIDKKDFAKFNDYMYSHQEYYEKRIKFIIDTLFESQKLNRSHSIDPNNSALTLENQMVEYKESLQKTITQNITTYTLIKENNFKYTDAESNELKILFDTYNQFKNGVLIENPKIESQIKSLLYVKNQGNVDYYLSNKTFEQHDKIIQENKEKIKKFKP